MTCPSIPTVLSTTTSAPTTTDDSGKSSANIMYSSILHLLSLLMLKVIMYDRIN